MWRWLRVARGDFFDTHPTGAALVVEVAISNLGFDREEKASLYAQSGVPDSWILDVDGRRMEVRRNPRIDREAPSGWRHGAVQELGPDDQIFPLSARGAAIGVAALLPGPRSPSATHARSHRRSRRRVLGPLSNELVQPADAPCSRPSSRVVDHCQ